MMVEPMQHQHRLTGGLLTRVYTAALLVGQKVPSVLIFDALACRLDIKHDLMFYTSCFWLFTYSSWTPEEAVP